MLLGIYLGSLLFAAILVGASLLGAGDDHGGAEHGLDHGLDADGDGHLEVSEVAHGIGHAASEAMKSSSGPWGMFLSLRFWTFFFGSFGLLGLLLAPLGLPAWATLLLTAPTGLGIGSLAGAFFARIRTDVVTGTTDLKRLVGQEARVMIPVRPGDIGKVVILSASGRVELPARTHDGVALDVGSTVLVADIEEGTAEVTGLPQPKPPPQRQTIG